MPTTLRAFGTSGPVPITVALTCDETSELTSLTFPRTLMFDRDTDGSWLVWVSTPDDDAEDTATGALVVRDPATTALLEELARLIATPEQFADEPRFQVAEPARI